MDLALIAYERVFAGGVRERLTQQHVRAVPNEGAEAVSDHYRSMRDRHIAHSVNPHEMSKVCAVVSPPSAMSREVFATSVLHVQLVGLTENDARQLGALATELRQQVAESAEVLQTVILEEAKALGVLYLLAQPPATFVVPGPKHVNTSRRKYRPDVMPAPEATA